jgi:hypothetical protein
VIVLNTNSCTLLIQRHLRTILTVTINRSSAFALQGAPHFQGIQQPVNANNDYVNKAIRLALIEWQHVYKDDSAIYHKDHSLYVGNQAKEPTVTEVNDLNRFIQVASSKLYQLKQANGIFITPEQGRSLILHTGEHPPMNKLA